MSDHDHSVELSDDGLLFSEQSPRAQLQNAILRAYLGSLSEELNHSPAERRMFVQLFAEPGLYRNRVTQEWVTGASIHALSCTGFNYYLYSSLNAQILSSLRRRYEMYFTRPHCEAYFLGGDCNDLARGVVAETELFTLTSQHPTPADATFCTYQCELQLHWATIATISRLPYVNLILYYPLDALNRQMPDAYRQRAETVVDAFFGGKAWRELYAQGYGRARQDLLFPYFCDRLAQLGFAEIVSDNDLNLLTPPTEDDPDLYRLLFVHKQTKGDAFWEQVRRAATPSSATL